MEYVDGVNLRQAIQAGGIDAKQALAIVPQICDALQFAHDEGVVHRDVKPENILVDKRGRVKIADFGLAKLLGQGPGNVSLTATQQVMGTLRYMAPEQMEGTKGVDHRADIYSLGVVFYELLTGELPIGRFAPPSKKVEIDVRLDEVVLRALEKEPEQRYQHASEVKTEVEQIASSRRTKGSQRDPTDLRASRWLRQWLAGCSGWATILSVFGAGATFLYWDWEQIPGRAIFICGYGIWYGLVSGAVFLTIFLVLVAGELLHASRIWSRSGHDRGWDSYHGCHKHVSLAGGIRRTRRYSRTGRHGCQRYAGELRSERVTQWSYGRGACRAIVRAWTARPWVCLAWRNSPPSR